MPITSLVPPRRGARANHTPIHRQAPVSGVRDTEGRTVPMDQGVPAGRWVCLLGCCPSLLVKRSRSHDEAYL